MVISFAQHFAWTSGLVASGAILFSMPCAAQIVRDGTLPTQIQRSGRTLNITGGAQVGRNLFHSFKYFDVPAGTTALFNNSAGITNIFGRVTGNKASLIDGTIKAQGNTNLTLFNPAGLTFGANAQLMLNGSFLGSTASSLQFADGTQFSAIAPETNPILTVSAPIGLQFSPNPGQIRVQGRGHNLSIETQVFSPFKRGEVAGLKVDAGNTLALVGGEVSLEGGTLSTDSGRIEVGGVRNGQVKIKRSPHGFALDYGAIQNFQDVTFRSKALADASGEGPGTIQVQGKNVSILNGSAALIQTQGIQDSLGLTVSGSDSILVRGTVPDASLSSGIYTETVALGKAGDISLNAPDITFQNGGTVFTATFTNAKGGNLSIQAPDSVKVLGFARLLPTRFSSISATTFGGGPAGSIHIETGQLTARNGGNIASVTGGQNGTGDGGDVLINAEESVELLGVTPLVFTPSQITAGTGGAGNAGSVTINTQNVRLRNGGRVDASTLATGDAGSVTINATESVEVRGRVPGALNPSLVNSSANLIDPALRELLGLPLEPTGAAGNLTINTPVLKVVQGGQVTVRNDGVGDAGTLRVNADRIELQEQGRLSASTQEGEGGNVQITTSSLFAHQNSAISAEAGGEGSGGNITLSGNSPAESIVLLGNSTITANAQQGRGGNILIETRGLFPCASCSISASSNLGIDGMVSFITPENETTEESINVVEQIIDPEAIVVQACTADGVIASNTLTVTGRGGLSPRPNTPLTGEALVDFEPSTQATDPQSVATKAKHTALHESTSASELPPPASGLFINAQGQASLTATSPSQMASLTSPTC